MTTSSLAEPDQLVTLGIDTHAEVHAVAALDERGRRGALAARPGAAGDRGRPSGPWRASTARQVGSDRRRGRGAGGPVRPPPARPSAGVSTVLATARPTPRSTSWR